MFTERITAALCVQVALAAALGFAVPAAAAEAASSNWPGFLGPAAPRTSTGELPLAWGPDKNIAWQAAIAGYGQSSPVVWGTHVFVTSVSGAMKETCHVTAFDLGTGQRLWQRDFPASSTAENNGYISKAAPSPVVDASGVVALFEGGNLVALDREGKPRWSRNLVEQYGELASRHGLASSLVQTEDLVVAWMEREAEPYLVAADKKDGSVRWKAEGLNSTSWSTPVLLSLGGQQQLVLSGGGKLAGYGLAKGERLWSFDKLSGNTIPTPQPIGEGTLLIGATVGRGEAGGANAAKSNGLVDVSQAPDGSYQVDFKWRCQRATSSFGSPRMHEGLAYFVNERGVLFCVDGQTGEEVYAERLADSVWATPLADGDRIYCAHKSGLTTIIRAGRQFEKLAENRLWPETSETPAVQYAIAAAGDRLLIRTGPTLYCISDSNSPAKAALSK